MYIHERYFTGLTQGEEGRGREKREEEGGRKIQKVFAFLHCSSTTMHNKAVNSLDAYIAMRTHSAYAELLLPRPNHAWEVRARCTPELNSRLIGSSRCAEV